MAMRGVNKVILIGNLGNEPDVRYFPSGDAVANVNLATSETWKDKKTGETQERTEWHRIQFMGKIAEVVQKYLHKGSKIYVEGKLRTRKWTDKSGQERYTTEVIVDMNGTMQMLDGKSSGFDAGASESYDNSFAAPQRAQGFQKKEAPKSTPRPAVEPQGDQMIDNDFQDDIPF